MITRLKFCFYTGDKLQDEELDNILEETDVQENLDGNIKFEGKLTD